MGSAKFGSFVFLAAALTKTAELALCVRFPFFRPPMGPIAILSALATTYYGEYMGVRGESSTTTFDETRIFAWRTRAPEIIETRKGNPLAVLPDCVPPPGYVPFSTPAYFTIGDMRVNEKSLLYSAVLLVSASPAVAVGGSVALTVESWCVVSWRSLNAKERLGV